MARGKHSDQNRKGPKSIYIRKMRYEEAYRLLDREIQAAFMKGETLVEVVHGIGEGVLKKMTDDYIREHSFLKILEDGGLHLANNPGSTLVEIMGPSSEDLKKYLK
ncbi:DNA mismatch repair protein MutS [Leptospira selangorensis]|uniref:DNA mismatch repair protein MutS n=1 Tax=Leptospira selangorensis TaxID=2484982 RepID=A0A5F2C2H8_9LEPT|nr:Smr/MutS family protein [Leptospira selangorensis]TGM11128.1 DNA mismatch repair protein MutS [Leptospira selangorensis]TGM19003.1 DNA mismatch repair protein MutS [Leptospira selangorensis]